MTLPPAGTHDICATCGHTIVYVGPHWEHVGDAQPRHIAMPSAWVPDFPGETIHADTISMGALGTITAGTLLGDLCAKCGEHRLHPEGAWLTVDPPQQRWTCQVCGHREIRPAGITAASTPTTIRVEDEAVVLTIDGAARLPAGTVITLTVTVGPGGALSVAPPAAVPARRYMNGGR